MPEKTAPGIAVTAAMCAREALPFEGEAGGLDAIAVAAEAVPIEEGR